ncbi:MAG: nickel/cobalt transporter [Nitratireductor sp.]|nr:nickel/cobalt transporter [Nitratireductor sp.]
MQVVRFSNFRFWLALLLAGAALVIILHPALAHAQNSLGLGRPEQVIKPTGFFGPLLFQIQQYQQEFYRSLTASLKAMRENGSNVWVLVGLSFAYGIFHAAGPGHGKAVISSYMLANEIAARRGIVLAFASAFLQALTAIVLISVVILFLRGTGIRSDHLTGYLEIASYAGITLLGAWLLWRKLFGGGHSHAAHEHHAGHAHAHHDHDHSDHGHDHHHHAKGEVCADCGHLHAPDPALLKGDFSLRQAWSAIIAVGLRPCSGAIIVLTFAFLNGLYSAGILSTLAMALGTGITVATLAALAVGAKDIAIRIGGVAESGASVHRIIEIGGALVVFLLGLTMLSASLYI